MTGWDSNRTELRQERTETGRDRAVYGQDSQKKKNRKMLTIHRDRQDKLF